MKKFITALLFLVQVFVFVSCEDRGLYDVSFSYAGIIDKEYRFNVGRVIPVTIGQSIETDGDISADGTCFYYTSNVDGGNFDIYLRAMGDITTVRLTSHPSKDTNPVISPDGGTLAFVSFRDDPEGDIYTVDLDSAELINKGRDTTAETDTLDAEVVNITSEKDERSEVTINGRDANPAWSPDGKWIAYSATRKGNTDIWIMKPDGGKKKKIAEGGDYPSFSPDGSKIVFISYKENSSGDLYIADVENGKTQRITSGQGIKLYPVFAGSNDELVYSVIENDTNKNGKLDLQDRSYLNYLNIKRGLDYRLTRESVSSFKAKWLPAVKTRDYSGVILYTDITGENINLNIIPETGIIPKKQNAKLQSEFCTTYIDEYDDSERYAMALESVYFFFGAAGDNSSNTYVDRSLGQLAEYYISQGRKKDGEKVIALLKKRSVKSPYAAMRLRMAESVLAGKKYDRQALLSSAVSDKNNGFHVPYAMEDIADSYYASGETESASAIYREIIKKFPEFERVLDINTKISLCDDDLRSGTLSASAEKIFASGTANQRIAVIRNLVSVFEKQDYPASETARYIKRMADLQEKYKENKKILPVIKYITALLYDRNGQTAEAEKEFTEVIKIAPQNDIVNHLANIRMGDNLRRSGKPADAEKYYSDGLNSYARRYRTENLREKLLWLVDYYEQSGIRLTSSGRPGDGAKNHEKNIKLLTTMHNKRLFPEVYTEYAARAHILYIDSYIEWKGEKSVLDLEKAYKGENDSNTALYKMDFNRAALYAMAYIYTRKALYLYNNPPQNIDLNNSDLVMQSLIESNRWIEWALFIDDKFIEPYILKSWIYQFVDYARASGDEKMNDAADEYFPAHLWEKNIPVLEKALTANDEKVNPENEGNIHLNMGNTYYLLLNYPRALKHYQLAAKYKKRFGSQVEQALFYFHTGYCYWQNNELEKARDEISRAYGIYRTLGAGKEKVYAQQYLILYRYFALFSRYEKKYNDAITWYRRIIEHADKYRLEIDRARYLQEIARCYIDLGDTSTAAAYIAQASEMLKEYPDDRRKYYAKVWVFGLGPFEVYDMGPDTLVIGDSSIYYPLDTFSKKLLNVSMQEEISLRNNDYAGAIRHLKNKIKITSEKDTALSRNIVIRSLNNLGYYYYLSGNFSESEKYFIQAADKSTEEGNLEGMFSSMMNLVNLYSMMIEENIDPSRDWQKVTAAVIKKISDYRNSYRDLRVQEELDDLDEQAKTKKREVTAEEKEAAIQKVNEETTAIYYSLDVAMSIMKFYRAEILYVKVRPDKTGTDPAFKLYSDNREIFGLYNESLETFESAIPVAEKQGNGELKCRLLMNSAVCYERTGEYEKAYVALLDARTIAVKYELRWLKIASEHALGSFMSRSGKYVEKGDSSALAEKYMSSAIGTAEEFPLLVVSHSNKIRQLYREYIDFLIASGRSGKAFTVSEKYSQFCRIALVNSISPVFRSSYDRKLYYDYVAASAVLSSIEREISDLLKTGVEPGSPAVNALRKKWRQQQEHLISLYDFTVSGYELIASYLKIDAGEIPDSGYDIFRFHQAPRGLFYWKISGKKITSGYAEGSGIDAANKVIGSGTEPVFIIPDEGTMAVFKNGMLSRPCSFISGTDRVKYYSSDTNPLTGDVISSVEGLKINAGGVTVNSMGDKFNPADYGVVVTGKGTGTAADPEYLYSSGLSPACIVIAGERPGYDAMIMTAEAGLFNGTARIIFSDTTSDSVSNAVNMLYKKDNTLPAFSGMVYGYIKTMLPEAGDAKKRAEAEYKLYNEKLKRCDFSAARIHLSRWYSLTGKTSREKYTVNLWMINILAGNYTSAADVIRQMNPSTPGEKSAYILMNTYQLLYTGKAAEAKNFFESSRSGIASKADIEFFEAIFSIALGGDTAAFKKTVSYKKPWDTLLPAERYIVLLVRYAALTDTKTARVTSAVLPGDAVLSEGERLFLMLVTGETPDPGSSVRFDRISAMPGYKDDPGMLSEKVKSTVTGDEGFDHLSVYPVLIAAGYCVSAGWQGWADIIINSSQTAVIAAVSEPLDALLLLKTAHDIKLAGGDYASALKAAEEMKKYISSAPYIESWIYSACARLLAITGEYKAAYESGEKAERLLASSGRKDTELTLLMINILEITGQYDEAQKRAELVTDTSTFSPREKFLFGIQRTLIELNRLGKLKSATTADAVLFEKLFSETLEALKKDPSLAAVPGTDLMVRIVFDEYINYRMRTGNYGDAHLVSEMKKIIFASAASGINLTAAADRGTFDNLQKMIPSETVYVNISKNRSDLFVWIIDGKEKKSFIIPGGYTAVEKIISRAESDISAGKDISAVSKDLNTLLQPVLSAVQKRKNIVFCCDSYTEKIPLEIAGDSSMLCEEHNLMFMASPFFIKGSVSIKTATVKILSYDEDNRTDYLERAAIRESGASYATPVNADGGMVHVAGTVSYSREKKAFITRAGFRPLSSIIKNAELLYMSAGETGSSSITDLVLGVTPLSEGEIVVNNSPVDDVNRSVFISSWYSGIIKGSGPVKSFLTSAGSLRSGAYRHPSNWMGLRIYLRSFNGI